jgi:hypothetical protein
MWGRYPSRPGAAGHHPRERPRTGGFPHFVGHKRRTAAERGPRERSAPPSSQTTASIRRASRSISSANTHERIAFGTLEAAGRSVL